MNTEDREMYDLFLQTAAEQSNPGAKSKRGLIAADACELTNDHRQISHDFKISREYINQSIRVREKGTNFLLNLIKDGKIAMGAAHTCVTFTTDDEAQVKMAEATIQEAEDRKAKRVKKLSLYYRGQREDKAREEANKDNEISELKVRVSSMEGEIFAIREDIFRLRKCQNELRDGGLVGPRSTNSNLNGLL